MAASIVPVVFSLNRGLWLSLGLALMYAMFRFWLRGDFRQALKVILAFAVVGIILVASPLGEPGHEQVLAQDRRHGPHRARPRGAGADRQLAHPRVRRPARRGAVAHPQAVEPRHRERDLPARLLARRPGARALPDLDVLHALPLGALEIDLGVLGPHHDPRGLHPASVLRRHRADTADHGGGRHRLPRDRSRPRSRALDEGAAARRAGRCWSRRDEPVRRQDPRLRRRAAPERHVAPAPMPAEHPDASGFRDTGVPEDEGQHLQSVYRPARAHGGPGRFGFDPGAHLTEDSPLVTDENRARLAADWEPALGPEPAGARREVAAEPHPRPVPPGDVPRCAARHDDAASDRGRVRDPEVVVELLLRARSSTGSCATRR